MRTFKKQHVCLLLSSLCFASSVVASSSSVSLNTKSQSKNDFSGHVSFQSNELVDDVGEVDGNRYNADFEFDYEGRSNSVEMKKKFKFASRINDLSYSMFSLEEANLQYYMGKSDLAVGRYILEWNKLDPLWGFGFINNRRNFDGFEPGQEGLTGVTLNYRNANGFNTSVFGSFIYIPEMNPGLQIDKEEGTITSKSPWAKAPEPSTQMEGETIPIYYDVEYPEIADVVFRYSVGFRAGWTNDEFSIDGFYMRKPENTVSTSANIALALKAEDEKDKVIVEVFPQFYYHDVVGGNISYDWDNNITVYGSALAVTPNEYPDGDRFVYQETGIEPEKKRQEYLGFGGKYQGNKFGVGANYVARVSEFNIVEDLLVEEPRWNQAVNINLNWKIKNKIINNFDVKYDMITEDRLLMVKTGYLVSKNLLMSVGVNMIGTSDDEESYWSDFKNNDAVYSSLKYVF